MSATLLIVDDEPLVRWSLRQHLEAQGHVVLEAETGRDARLEFSKGVDLVLLDVCLPDAHGGELLKALRIADAAPPVILITAHSSVEGAVDAMRHGAFHYLRKPFDLEQVGELVAQALEQSELSRKLRRRRQSSEGNSALERIVGESHAMHRVKRWITRVAESPASTVLLSGESGTGKDLAARAIHDLSDRSAGPFINVTCSALAETLLESELFGHERGAFTDARQQRKGLLEQADGGSVFLDEVSETSVAFQAKLLRFLEEKAFRRVGGTQDIKPDVRIIAATNRNLEQEVANGRFREDLYYRLAVFEVELPPLRQRGGDVELVAADLVARLNLELQRSITRITPAAMDLLRAHTWPGNVRELRNAIERAMLFADGDVLEPTHFAELVSKKEPPVAYQLPPHGVDFAVLEKSLVAQALERCQGNQTRAASLLGMNRDQVRYRIQKFGLDRRVGPRRAHTPPEPDIERFPAFYVDDSSGSN